MVSHVAVGLAFIVAVGVGALIFSVFTSRTVINQPMLYEREPTPSSSRSSSNYENPIPPHNCTICLDPVESYRKKILRCGHNFHINCHAMAVRSGISCCPICRKKTM